MLKAAEAPAPTAMQKIAIAPRIGFTDESAQTIPVIAVKITSDITRGFNSWT